MMDEEEIKALVLKKIKKTKEQIADYKDMAQPISPDDSLGRITRMDAINNKSVVDAAIRQAEDKLSKLKHVLNKLGTDDFGKCGRCGGSIPIQRILIMPESAYCVKCASR